MEDRNSIKEACEGLVRGKSELEPSRMEMSWTVKEIWIYLCLLGEDRLYAKAELKERKKKKVEDVL